MDHLISAPPNVQRKPRARQPVFSKSRKAMILLKVWNTNSRTPGGCLEEHHRPSNMSIKSLNLHLGQPNTTSIVPLLKHEDNLRDTNSQPEMSVVVGMEQDGSASLESQAIRISVLPPHVHCAASLNLLSTSQCHAVEDLGVEFIHLPHPRSRMAMRPTFMHHP